MGNGVGLPEEIPNETKKDDRPMLSDSEKIRAVIRLAQKNRRDTQTFINGLREERASLVKDNSFFVQKVKEIEDKIRADNQSPLESSTDEYDDDLSDSEVITNVSQANTGTPEPGNSKNDEEQEEEQLPKVQENQEIKQSSSRENSRLGFDENGFKVKKQKTHRKIPEKNSVTHHQKTRTEINKLAEQREKISKSLIKELKGLRIIDKESEYLFLDVYDKGNSRTKDKWKKIKKDMPILKETRLKDPKEKEELRKRLVLWRLESIAEEELRLQATLKQMRRNVRRLKRDLEKEQPTEKRQGSRGGNATPKKNQKKAGASSSQSTYSESGNKTARKQYFQEELKRLRGGLEREGSKIHKPTRKAYTPYTFTTLEPYYNTTTQEKVINHEPKEPKGYVPRKTAIGLCDPWVDHNMDVELLPKPVEKDDENQSPRQDKGQAQPKKTHKKAEGSTRLPKFPSVQMPTGEMATKPLNYGDVPHLRQELKTKYGANSSTKVNEEYERTKNDFYRMDLDKLEEYHPMNRDKMTEAYKAYLQNNPGSKKAIEECIESAKKELEENGGGTSRPHSAVSRPRSAVSQRSQRPQSSHSNKAGSEQAA